MCGTICSLGNSLTHQLHGAYEPHEENHKMLKISILKVENPACLWGRVEGGSGSEAQTTQQYNSLTAQMNLFYHDVTQDQHKLKHTSVKKGQVCVVYWTIIKSWCRARIEAVITDSVSCQARCFLLDFGEQVVIPSDQIRVAMPDFLLLPFWVRRFHLSGIKPTRLQVSVNEEKAKMIPSCHWDSSATLYLHNLLQASTRTEAVLHESEADSTSIQLYLMFGNIKFCVNDELVAKKFAYYRRDPDSVDSGLDELDRKPVMLSSSILTQTVNYNKPKTQTPTPPVTSHNQAAAEACDWLTTNCTQKRDKINISEEDNCPKVTERQQLSDNQSNKSPGACAAESDSSEDTDSSLAAALTKNINLFKFLKFLNPQSIYKQTDPCTQDEKPDGLEDTTGAVETCTPPLEPITADEVMPHNMSSDTGSPQESEPAEKEMSWRSEEHWACSRLLEWLNPEALNTNTDSEDVEVSPTTDPEKDLLLVHSAFPLQPFNNLDVAPLTDNLRRLLQRKKLYSLCPADRYSWPAVARGCHSLIVSPNAHLPISYLPPLLTHVLLNSIFASPASSTGPIAVVVCPGWEKAQAVYDHLGDCNVNQILHPMTVLVGVGKDEAKFIKIPQNCLLIVTTPFSLVRVLSHHCFLFLRMYHLVLDEVDQLFSLAPEQMTTILQHFQKVTSSEDKTSCPQQIIAVAKQWTSPMEGLLTSYMPHSSIIISVPEEAALYANIQQVILMSLESNKMSVLLGTLDFNPDVGQKTLIIASSPQKADDVFEVVSNKSAFCLKCHEGLMHQFDSVVEQWRKGIGRGTHVILVTTNDCLRCLGIRDATCVIHYGFPNSPRMFGSRLFCMAKNFRNLTEPGSQDKVETVCRPTRSVLIISERNARHVFGVLRYLGRTSAPLPHELLSFAQGVHMAREDQKTNRPLCNYLKSFGACRDSSVCPDRHRWNSRLDKSELPASGVIEIVPLFIKTASVFYGRIVTKEERHFESMATDMASFYADKKPGATEVLEGRLYAVQENEVFHRVKILSVPDQDDRLFFCVFVEFIDVGKRDEVKAHQLLQLPEKFQSVPGQAVEIVVCRVKPADAETDWHPKVTRAISQKIRGLQHRAKVVLSLGNTIFVDPMVRVTQVPGMKTVINEYNVQSEILNSGMGVSNPEHINLLKALCETDTATRGTQLSVSANGVTSLENRIKPEEEVLAEAFRAAEVRKHAAADSPHLETPSTVSVVNKPVVPPSPLPLPLSVLLHNLELVNSSPVVEQKNTATSQLKTTEAITSIKNNVDIWPQNNKVAQNGMTEDNQQINILQTIGQNEAEDSTKSLHPLIRWYQTSDSITVTVKLLNPETQSCNFYPHRVLYRGRLDGRLYKADLELQGNIDTERSSWKIKSNEPVLKLIKQKQVKWDRLLKEKNIFVSYDLEHFDEDEDKAFNGFCFVEDTGEDNWYVNSETDSDSD